MVAASNGKEGVEWIPEAHYTRDPETTRVNVFKDVRGVMRNPERDRIVLLGIVPVWAVNEITDEACGGFSLTIENLFCGVPSHPEYVRIMDKFDETKHDAQRKRNPAAIPHPDDTGRVRLFVQAGQRGAFDEVFHTLYVARALPKGISQFGGAEDVLLVPASQPTMRDAMQHDRTPKDNDEGPEAVITIKAPNAVDTHKSVANSNNDDDDDDDDPLIAARVLTVSQRDVPKADFELVRADHPIMTFLNEFGETLRNEGILRRGDITAMDPQRQSMSVRNTLSRRDMLIYRVGADALQRAREWLCVRIYRNIRYTRLTGTGLRIVTRPDQSKALYTMYRKTLMDRPEQAPCITIVLHVTYMIVNESDRMRRLQNKATL